MVSALRILRLLAVLALLLAPLGRTAAVEALAPLHHQPSAMPAHCQDRPAPEDGSADKASIDCTIACTAMTAVEAPLVSMSTVRTELPAHQALPLFSGIQIEADPPPPRFS